MRDIATRRVTVRPLGRYPVLSIEPVARTGWRAVFKRTFDVVAATLALIVASPILAVAAIAIRIDSGPGVLFSQTRVGRNGQPFRLYKLRTMVNNAEDMLDDLKDQNVAAGPMFKMVDDPRVTRVGGFLRKSSLDELPQLLNVLTGDMSLVGPRPAMPHEALQWNDDLRERLRVQPGITGNWQVNGRFTASLEDYQRLDLYYVDNWSVVTDLVILLKTIPAVLRRNGAV
jgi:exopolysaccharide biosynthesis polyprenyl glycosylphosphotransferase